MTRGKVDAGSDVKRSFREIAARAVGMPGFSMKGGPEPGLEGISHFTPDRSTYSNGTHIAEVEVDIETGAVNILCYTVLHDCGAVINPMVVEGQVVGGIAHGIGNALFERLIHDHGAQPQTTSFADYLLPRATDMAPIAILHSETPSPLNPLGLKGAGEGGTIASIAAIIGAVEKRARAIRRQDQRSADQPGADRGAGEGEAQIEKTTTMMRQVPFLNGAFTPLIVPFSRVAGLTTVDTRI